MDILETLVKILPKAELVLSMRVGDYFLKPSIICHSRFEIGARIVLKLLLLDTKHSRHTVWTIAET